MASSSNELICSLIGSIFIPQPETITESNIHFWNVTEEWLQAIIELKEALNNFLMQLLITSSKSVVAIVTQLNELYGIIDDARQKLNAHSIIKIWLSYLKFDTPLKQLIGGFLNLPRPIPPTVTTLSISILSNNLLLPCFERPLREFLSNGLTRNSYTQQQYYLILPIRKKIYNEMLIKIIKLTQAFGTPLNTPSCIDFQWMNIWELLGSKIRTSNLPISPSQKASINNLLSKFTKIAPSQRNETTTLLFLFACSERSSLDLTTFLTLLVPSEQAENKEQDIKFKRRQMSIFAQLPNHHKIMQPSLKNFDKEQQNDEAQFLLYLMSQMQIGLENIVADLQETFSGGATQEDQIPLAINFKHFMDIDTSMPFA